MANWRVATIATQTVDEYGVLFRNLFAMAKLEASEIRGIIISSVVPPLDSTLREVCETYFNSRPLFVEPGVKTGMQSSTTSGRSGRGSYREFGGSVHEVWRPMHRGRFRNSDHLRLRFRQRRVRGRRDLSGHRDLGRCAV